MSNKEFFSYLPPPPVGVLLLPEGGELRYSKNHPKGELVTCSLAAKLSFI